MPACTFLIEIVLLSLFPTVILGGDFIEIFNERSFATFTSQLSHAKDDFICINPHMHFYGGFGNLIKILISVQSLSFAMGKIANVNHLLITAMFEHPDPRYYRAISLSYPSSWPSVTSKASRKNYQTSLECFLVASRDTEQSGIHQGLSMFCCQVKNNNRKKIETVFFRILI